MNKLISKGRYMRLLLPAVITSVLVAEGLLGYVSPALPDAIETPAAQVFAAEPPELEIKEQTAKKTVSKGPAGKLRKFTESGDYKDGIYTGSAKGFGGTITVRVTIKDGKIKKVSIVSASGETSSYFNRAKILTSVIAKKQTTNVDAVSGATYSSNGIIKAVRNALKKAQKKKSSEKNKKDASKKTEGSEGEQYSGTDPDPGSDNGDYLYKDGTYDMTSACNRSGVFDYDIEMTLTVKDGRLSQLTVSKGEDYSGDAEIEEDNDWYLAKASSGMIGRILSAQKADVDTVTGATYSSKSIRSALDKLLKTIRYKAEKPEEETEEPTDAEPDDAEDEPDQCISPDGSDGIQAEAAEVTDKPETAVDDIEKDEPEESVKDENEDHHAEEDKVDQKEAIAKSKDSGSEKEAKKKKEDKDKEKDSEKEKEEQKTT